MIFPATAKREEIGIDYVDLPYGQYTQGPAPLTNRQKTAVKAQLSKEATSIPIIRSKWNYYCQAWGKPTTAAEANRIKDAIAADLMREKLYGNRALVESVIGSGIPLIRLPWFLNPKNMLLLGGAGVVVYFTWPLLLKAGVGTVKRGVRSLAK